LEAQLLRIICRFRAETTLLIIPLKIRNYNKCNNLIKNVVEREREREKERERERDQDLIGNI